MSSSSEHFKDHFKHVGRTKALGDFPPELTVTLRSCDQLETVESRLVMREPPFLMSIGIG